MLKRIHVDQLQLGMYIHEFCGSWMDHPFWRPSFLLEDAKDLKSIQAGFIREVWIDSRKGLDVAANVAVVTQAQAEARVEQTLRAVAEARRRTGPVSTPVELQRAALICRRSRQAVTTMFDEARMGKAVDGAGAQHLVEEISDSVTRNASALICLARLKTVDDYTYMHSVAVCGMMIALARQLGLDDAQTRSAGLAGLLHDIGKVAIPPEVLNKPGRLTDEEFAIIKSHPGAGHHMLLGLENVDPIALDVCLHHHEKTDGSGYPHGLKGDEISLFAKMGAVCDVYDAITSNRPYKAGWSPAESMRKMAEWADGHFDQTVFQAFVKSLGIYPIGSLVRLASGRLAVVVEQSTGSLTTPIVKVFYSTKSDLRIPSEVIDLSSPHSRDKIAGREDPALWKFPDLDELWSGVPGQAW